jgi:hypothetical protein
MLAVFPFRQYQFVQTEVDALTIRLVADRDPTGEERAGLADLARHHLHVPLEVTVERVSAIARGPGGKFEDYVCRVGQGETPR